MTPCRGRLIGAHRVSYEYCYGRLESPLVVRHECDCRACFKPGHLSCGLPRDNVLDRVARGRSNIGDRIAFDDARLGGAAFFSPLSLRGGLNV
ncbi:MAG: HNH endonuclease [Microviridae sp.]|nr:MAG: HNH endonuclease [Microviridae sp.]